MGKIEIDEDEFKTLQERLEQAESTITNPLMQGTIGKEQVDALMATTEEMRGIMHGIKEKIDETGGQITELSKRERTAIEALRKAPTVPRSRLGKFLGWLDAALGVGSGDTDESGRDGEADTEAETEESGSGGESGGRENDSGEVDGDN